MSAALSPFDFQGQTVRIVTDDAGAPWFVAGDVCRALDLDNVGQAIAGLDDDERGSITIADGTPGNPNRATVNEPGLYSLVLRSRKPEAKAFKRWVTHEVLPAIRRTGGYQVAPALTDEQIVAQALQITTRRVQELEAQVQADAPKVLFAEAVTTSQTAILVGDLAKILRGNGIEVGANRLFEWLRRDGYLIRRQGTDWNMPTQYSMERGLFRIKETAITHADGHVTISRTPKVTGKGQAHLVTRYNKRLQIVEAAS